MQAVDWLPMPSISILQTSSPCQNRSLRKTNLTGLIQVLISIVYDSGYGHTAKQAQVVAADALDSEEAS